MAPLVMVLAFLPTLYAVAHRTLTEAGARQGLLSLQCLSAQTLNEFIDPATTGTSPSLASQPLLMNWFTALALKTSGVGQVAGQVASAYLCTACLILATYVLARRLGGDRLGLMSALLLAFNPHILKLAQEPLPQSGAALFAVLAMAGAVAHWQKSSSVASVQLLLGGIALGLCLLAGGPVAIATLAILVFYAAGWKIDRVRHSAIDSPFERSQLNRGKALRSLLVLALTGFAVGGWRSLLMGSRYGAQFWDAWFRLRETDSGTEAAAAGASWVTLLLRANQLVLPLSVLSLAGIAVIGAEVWRRSEDPGRRHRGLLLTWLAVAGPLWLWATPGDDLSIRPDAYWTALFIVPLTMTAAAGLLAVIDRLIPFRWAVMIGVLTVADALFVGRETARVPEFGGTRTAGWMMFLWWMVGAFIILAWLSRVSLSAEARRRGVLTALVLGVIAANCLWGSLAVRRASTADRELEDLRTGLVSLGSVKRWTLVVPTTTAGPVPEPPPQLVYALRSLWPEGEMLSADSWESLSTQLATETAERKGDRRLIITWSPRGRVRPTAPAGLLKSAARPCVYREHEVAAYFPGETVRPR